MRLAFRREADRDVLVLQGWDSVREYPARPYRVHVRQLSLERTQLVLGDGGGRRLKGSAWRREQTMI